MTSGRQPPGTPNVRDQVRDFLGPRWPEWTERRAICEGIGRSTVTVNRVMYQLGYSNEVERREFKDPRTGLRCFEYRAIPADRLSVFPLYPERTGKTALPLAQAWGGYTYVKGTCI